MRTAGISVGRLAGMTAISGFVLLVVTALIGEFIGPPLDYFARNMRNEARFEQEESVYGSDLWVKDGAVVLNLERINTEFEFGSLYQYRFNDDRSLHSISRAGNAGIDEESDRWILENVRETVFTEDGLEASVSPVSIETFDVNSDLLGITLVKPVSLSGRGLLSYIGYLKRNGLTAERYETELWSRISRTATVLVMPMLALAFVFGSLRSSGYGTRLMLGVLVGLAYFLASEMLANSGQVFNLNPAVVTWLPSIALVLVTVFALSRVR
jgi:lipopolysaccharide export system permease protein